MQGQKPGNLLAITLGLVVLACAQWATPLKCQSLLPPHLQDRANRLFDQPSETEQLNCKIWPSKVFLDFTFRFGAGFGVSCPVWQFGGRRTRVTIFVRVTPKGGTPVLLGAFLVFRGLPLKPPPGGKINRKLYFITHGGFSVGEGRYRVEVLLEDQHHRTRRRSWQIKVSRRWQKSVPVVLAAHQVSSFRQDDNRGNISIRQARRTGKELLHCSGALFKMPGRGTSSHQGFVSRGRDLLPQGRVRYGLILCPQGSAQ